MNEKNVDACLARLFTEARSRNAWREETIPDETWKALYDLLKMGPTSANVSPARFVFCTSADAKGRVARHMSATNAEKSIKAPAIVIVAHDLRFADKIPQLFPHNPDARFWFADEQVRDETAFRNGTLQGAYLMIAARALSLDCGPMSGFDKGALDADFFPDGTVRSNFLCAIGHGIDEPLGRLPRLAFGEACSIL